ncbi:MAG: cell wall-binding repeat-containing protein [Salinibacterium sp.]|nr:cell wall-binding repeat-containing protein [Salinibacterium sp.]
MPIAYIATGVNYPDALSAAPAAAALGGPLLLTAPTALPDNVRDELVRLRPALIVVVGGVNAVSDAVFAQLTPLATTSIRRDAGTDRYQTSRIINEGAFPHGATTAFIATGSNFPDALSASAAAGSIASPVVLVNGQASTIDSDTAGLLGALGVTTVKIAGGTAVVSPAIESALDTLYGASAVQRLAGTDRYGTSIAINSASFASAATAYLAVGTGFADALAGAALAGRNHSPLFVVPGNCVPAAVTSAITALGATNRVLFGGTAVLNGGVEFGTECFYPAPVSDGTRAVGAAMPAGTWVSTRPGDFCVWERLSSLDGQPASVIGGSAGYGQQITTVQPSDAGFTSDSCGGWTAVQNAPALTGIPSDGVFLVGQQVPAGLYQAPNSPAVCFWATLSAFSGQPSDIIADNGADTTSTGHTTVQIPATAQGFESDNCGVWTKIG